tara:strand:+ start:207 stop:395 length:189 start_codon:yes stop_codon:yes gene_type:complete
MIQIFFISIIKHIIIELTAGPEALALIFIIEIILSAILIFHYGKLKLYLQIISYNVACRPAG